MGELGEELRLLVVDVVLVRSRSSDLETAERSDGPDLLKTIK
jgi:hypothetical protein